MDAATRAAVRQRAGDCCEYSRLRQSDFPFSRFQIERIIAQQHGGGDEQDNLVLACDRCNVHTGPNLSDVEPVGGQVVRLFDPRRDIWDEHFLRNGPYLAGRTPTGRSTVSVLKMNEPARVELRRLLLAENR
jgi:hypothetical protein